MSKHNKLEYIVLGLVILLLVLKAIEFFGGKSIKSENYADAPKCTNDQGELVCTGADVGYLDAACIYSGAYLGDKTDIAQFVQNCNDSCLKSNNNNANCGPACCAIGYAGNGCDNVCPTMPPTMAPTDMPYQPSEPTETPSDAPSGPTDAPSQPYNPSTYDDNCPINDINSMSCNPFPVLDEKGQQKKDNFGRPLTRRICWNGGKERDSKGFPLFDYCKYLESVGAQDPQCDPKVTAPSCTRAPSGCMDEAQTMCYRGPLCTDWRFCQQCIGPSPPCLPNPPYFVNAPTASPSS